MRTKIRFFIQFFIQSLFQFIKSGIVFETLYKTDNIFFINESSFDYFKITSDFIIKNFQSLGCSCNITSVFNIIIVFFFYFIQISSSYRHNIARFHCKIILNTLYLVHIKIRIDKSCHILHIYKVTLMTSQKRSMIYFFLNIIKFLIYCVLVSVCAMKNTF